jgi:ribosomal protein S18 acetylase RimI-like enzyme
MTVISSTIKIREFRFPSDYEFVYQLWKSIEKGVHLGRSDTLAEIAKKITRDPDLFLVAESDRGIIGAVMGGFDGRRGLIYHLAVATSFRGMGIGSRLMDEVESRLRAKGCLKCYLLVTTDNPEAEGYYQHRGWQHMDTIRLFGKELG